jgi:4-amino-4-deoxychorismate lyase
LESITFENYIRKPATSFKLIECNHIDYHLKRSDRSLLDDLFSKRGNCDEIIIVKEGVVTDTSVSNLIFLDGTTWYTPDMPLLKGTCRQRLLEKGMISERHIRPEDLYRFSGLKMINAMRYLNEETIVPVSSISM